MIGTKVNSLKNSQELEHAVPEMQIAAHMDRWIAVSMWSRFTSLTVSPKDKKHNQFVLYFQIALESYLSFPSLPCIMAWNCTYTWNFG